MCTQFFVLTYTDYQRKGKLQTVTISKRPLSRNAMKLRIKWSSNMSLPMAGSSDSKVANILGQKNCRINTRPLMRSDGLAWSKELTTLKSSKTAMLTGCVRQLYSICRSVFRVLASTMTLISPVIGYRSSRLIGLSILYLTFVRTI